MSAYVAIAPNGARLCHVEAGSEIQAQQIAGAMLMRYPDVYDLWEAGGSQVVPISNQVNGSRRRKFGRRK